MHPLSSLFILLLPSCPIRKTFSLFLSFICYSLHNPHSCSFSLLCTVSFTNFLTSCIIFPSSSFPHIFIYTHTLATLIYPPSSPFHSFPTSETFLFIHIPFPFFSFPHHSKPYTNISYSHLSSIYPFPSFPSSQTSLSLPAGWSATRAWAWWARGPTASSYAAATRSRDRRWR